MLRAPIAALLALAAVCALAPAASAAPTEAQPSAGPQATAAATRVVVSPPVVTRGEQVAIRGSGWRARSRVRLMIGLPQSDAYPIATVRANARGRFVKRVRMRGLPGPYIVVACPVGACPRPARAAVRIVRAGTGGRTLLHSALPRSRYLAEPRFVGYRGDVAGRGIATLTLERLRWQRWAAGRAQATGRARVCATAGGCRTVSARVLATRRVRYESREWFYARLVVRLGGEAGIDRRRLTLCTLPAICGGPPHPP